MDWSRQMASTALPRPAELPDKRLIAPAMKGFFLIMERWGIDNERARILLGAPAARTFYLWKSGQVARVPMDTLRRIGYVSGIWKALQIVYADAALADRWVKAPNLAFAGLSPLDRMAAGDVTDLAAVRSYIDAARAPWS
jgi:hypothetical protein